MKICLDPGHGGTDPGAVGFLGTKESHVNLDVCLELKKLLEEKGHETVLTRSVDKSTGLGVRVDASAYCDFLISVHCNSVGNSGVEGVEVLYSLTNPKSRDLASFMLEAILNDPDKPKEHKDRGLKLSPSPGYPRNIYMVNHPTIPSCLVELEFISNRFWEMYLRSSKENIAKPLFLGIEKFMQTLV